MTAKLPLTCLLIFSTATFAGGVDATKHLPYGSRSAQLIAPLSAPQQALIENNTEQFFPPASTLKVVTALAAKLVLPDSFRFETTLYTSGNDLIIKYSGDPTFSRASLTTMLKQAKSEVGARFNNVWLDDSVFTGYQRGVGWPWDILGVCYSAPASAITLDGNCVQGALYTNKNGTTRINVPSHQPISASTSAKSVSKDYQEQSYCDLQLEVSPNNQYSLSGCAVERKSPIPLKFAVSSPEQFTVDVIKSELSRIGVSLSGEVKVGTPNIKGQKPLFIQRSRPLNDLLAVMLQDSNNLYADNITKTLGMSYFNQPGSFINGTEAIKAIIKQKAGINLDLAVLEDGSGLSRNNRVTASQMREILSYIHNNDSTLKLARLMPVSGNNGTLKYRSSMRKAPVKGALVAKSGSLFGTYNMMGFGLGSKGERESLFVQFVTDYHPKKATNSKPVESPLTQFEKAYYRQVVDYSYSLERSNNKAQP